MIKEITDNDIKRKAVKLVVAHIRKKLPADYEGEENLDKWIAEIEVLLDQDEFQINKYYEKRNELNDVVDRMINDELRYRLRDSWYSFGKALEKKKKPR